MRRCNRKLRLSSSLHYIWFRSQKAKHRGKCGHNLLQNIAAKQQLWDFRRGYNAKRGGPWRQYLLLYTLLMGKP